MIQSLASCASTVARFVLIGAIVSACGSDVAAPQSGRRGNDKADAVPLPADALNALDVAQPAGWADDLALNIPVDMNPDPNILEIEMEARVADIEFLPGMPTPAWTYGGTVPGPLIRAKVGDRVIVHFKNSLPEGTSIHWHGLRVPNGMDGVPGVTQDPVPSDGEFRYEFVVNDAGTYWYHPHINSAAQVGWGMYGPIVVDDPQDPPEFGDDLILVLSDIGLDDVGQFLPPDIGGEFGDLFGREGTVVLVNGKVMPTLRVRKGKQQRWRVINAARARYYNIRMPGHTLVDLGGDNGLAERSQEVYNVILVPGERGDFVFTPNNEPGSSEVLQWIPVDRGFSSMFNRPRVDMMRIETTTDPAVRPEPIPVDLREIHAIDTTDAVELKLDLTIDTDYNKQVVMGINGIPYWDVVPIEAAVGQTQIWHLVNDTAFAHPFHLHGYFFQVLDDTLIPEWKDTVDVPSETSLRIAVRFDDRPGMWMYHCHILDHAESGMMGQLHVAESPPETAAAPSTESF
jgi:FtsP/CotA-like multicopper oxidase with cupredoxin domain